MKMMEEGARQMGSGAAWRRVRVGILSTVLGGAALIGCASGLKVGQGEAEAVAVEAAAPAAVAPRPTALEPYQLTIPGTLVKIDMIPVEGGSVTMQTEEGPKTVEVKPFWISRTEIPWEAYDAFLFKLDLKDVAVVDEMDAASRPSKPYVLPGENFGHEGRPALGMTFIGANAFAGWLSYKTGAQYRIPTEAEWEYACRAGAQEPTADQLKEYAWYWDNSSDMTQKLGLLKPNAWGVHDMLGNVAEWVDAGLDAGLVKGGAWNSDADEVSCATREPYSEDWQLTDPQIPKSTWWMSDAPFVGLRLIRVPE